MRKNILIIVLTILSIAPNTFAQSISPGGIPSPNNTYDPEARERRRLVNENIIRMQSDKDNAERVPDPDRFPSPDSSYNSLMRKNVKRMKTTGFEDEYKEFLKQPNTGLVKLLKKIDCLAIFAERKYSTAEKNVKICPSFYIPGKGIYYSFRHDNYVSPVRSDLGLMNDWFFSVGMLNQSLMVDLGDVNLDELNLQSEGIRFLSRFVPETNAALADRQREDILKGIKDKNYLYSNAIKFKKNSVIGLRVVAYGSENKTKTHKNATFEFLSGDKRKDIIVVFKVIDKADDGSVVLLWKQLQIKDSPNLIIG